MYIDFRRFRAGATALILLPVVAAGVTVYALSSSSSSPTPTTLPGATTIPTTLPIGATTIPGHHTTTPTIKPTSLNLAGRKAAVLASEAHSIAPSAALFNTRFLQLANRGPAPHYRVLTPLGGYAKYPQVLRLGVVGSSQIICIALPSQPQPMGIPSSVVVCP